MVQRISRTHVPKQHAKFFYEVSYPTGGRQDKILLDVLFEESHYGNVIKAPIQSRFLKQQGEPVMVKLPSKEDLLGDKLTAFAPHTTGIPFFKGEKNYSMEICKQLFDIATLFDSISDLTVTTETFRKFVSTELQYRNNKTTDLQSVLNDIYDTALCIMQRGLYNPHEFELLQDGIKRVRGFIHSEVYSIDSAITNAAKAAYLSKLIEVPELLSQIKRVVGGKVVVSNRLMAALTRAFREDTGEVDRDLNCLTSREKDVLKCLSIGMSNQQTGEYLSIQLGTVKVHVKHILKKMGFASRTQAALWARDRGVTI